MPRSIQGQQNVSTQSGTLLPAGTPGTKDARTAYPSGPSPLSGPAPQTSSGLTLQAHWPRAVHLPQGHLWAVGRSPWGTRGLGQRAGQTRSRSVCPSETSLSPGGKSRSASPGEVPPRWVPMLTVWAYPAFYPMGSKHMGT